VFLEGTPADGVPLAFLDAWGLPMDSDTHSVVLVGFLSYLTRSTVRHQVDTSLREDTVPPLESVEQQRVTIRRLQIYLSVVEAEIRIPYDPTM